MKSRRYHPSGVIAACVLSLAIGAQTAGAQTDQVSKVSFDPAVKSSPEPAAAVASPTRLTNEALVTRVGVHTASPVPLALEDAIRRALTNNNSIEIARNDVRIQETAIRSLLGTYDPVFSVSPTLTRNSTTGNSATSDFNVNANVLQFIRPGGGDYQVFFNNTRTENAFSQAQVSSGALGGGGSSAIYSSSLGFRYRQPLMRNFGIDNTRRN